MQPFANKFDPKLGLGGPLFWAPYPDVIEITWFCNFYEWHQGLFWDNKWFETFFFNPWPTLNPMGPYLENQGPWKYRVTKFFFLLLLNSLIINGSFETLTFEIRHHRPPPDPKNQYRHPKSAWGSQGYPYLQPVLS